MFDFFVFLFNWYCYISAALLIGVILYSPKLAREAEIRTQTIIYWKEHFKNNVPGSWIFFDGAGN